MGSRKCAWRGCKTILNSYNSHPCCSVHKVMYEDLMNERISGCEAEISKFKTYIREAKNLRYNMKKIKKIKHRIKRLEQLRDRRFLCKTVDSYKSIFAQTANLPDGF